MKAHITGRDRRLVLMKHQLESTMAFLECFYAVGLATNRIEAKYDGETPEEEDLIRVKGLKIGKKEHALNLTFDMITRALMAGERYEGPRFESTLANTARDAIPLEQYINSFRYSFLLIEALFGGGQFKKEALKGALKSNPQFMGIVENAIKDRLRPKSGHVSDTETLLVTSADASAVVNHLVEKRGFYFHGNVKRKDAWKAEDQRAAEALALLALAIAQLITQESAQNLFRNEFSKRHFEQAEQAGATIVFRIDFEFQEPEEPFVRKGQITVRTPGTKIVGKQANAILQNFLRQFEHDAPVATLLRARCVEQATQNIVFEIGFDRTTIADLTPLAT